jgi:rhodanese-related sulfurtransferase
MKTKIIIQMLLLLFFTLTTLNAQNKMEVTSTEVDSLLNKNSKFIVLDVRTPEEFADGHVRGAINIDVHQTDALDRINKLDKNAKYIVYCRTKNRSGVVVNNMMQNGFKTIYQMMDGIVGWNLNKLPVVK